MRGSGSSMTSCPANKAKKARSSPRREILESNNTSITSEGLKLILPMKGEDAQAKTTSAKTVAGKQEKDNTSPRRFEKSQIITASNTQQQGFDSGFYDANKEITDKRGKAAGSVKSVSSIFGTKKVWETFKNRASLADDREKISEKHTNKTDDLFSKTCKPFEAEVYVDRFPLHNPKNNFIGKALVQENSTTEHQIPDLSTCEKRTAGMKRRESVEENPVLPPKIRKYQKNCSQCASSKKVQNTRTDDIAISNLMPIEKIILSLPETSSFLLRSCEQGNCILKCPKCCKVFKQLKLGSMHYSMCKNFKLMKNKDVSVSPPLLVLVCNLCYSTFEDLAKLSEHNKVCQLKKSSDVPFESATSRNKYKCKKCCYECFSSIKFKEHSCNKNIEKMQLCSIKMPTLDITQSRKSTLQCFECTRCCRLFLDMKSFNDHMKIAHNLEVPATESLKNLTVHNPFCPSSSQIKVKNVSMSKENINEKEKSKHRIDTTCGKINHNNEKTEQGKEKEHRGDKEKTRHSASFNINDLVPDTTAVPEVIRFIKSVGANGLQQDRQNLSLNLESKLCNIQASGLARMSGNQSNSKGIQKSGSVKMSSGQTNSGNDQTSGLLRRFNDKTDFSTIQSDRSVEISQSKIIPDRIRSSISIKMYKDKTSSGNVQETESVKTSRNQTNFSNIQTSGSEQNSNSPLNEEGIFTFPQKSPKASGCSEDVQWPFLQETMCKCRGYPDPENDIKPCVECLEKSVFRSEDEAIEPRQDSYNDSREEVCAIASESIKTNPKSFRASGSVTMFNGQTGQTQASKITKIVQAYRRLASKTKNLKATEFSEDLEGPCSKKETCGCQGRLEEDIKPCEECLNRSILRSVEQTINPKLDPLKDSREKQCSIDNSNTDMAPKETLKSGLLYGTQSECVIDDLSNLTTVYPGNLFNGREEECEENNLDIDVVSPRITDSGPVCSNSRYARIESSVSFYESPESRVNSKEEDYEKNYLDISMVSRMAMNSGPQPAINDISIPIVESPCSRFNSTDEECGEDNLDIDVVPPKTTNSGLACSQSRSARDEPSVPLYEALGNRANSREEDCEEDIKILLQETINFVSVCSQPQSAKDAISIPIYESPGSCCNSIEEECEEDNLNIDVVSPKVTDSDLVTSSNSRYAKVEPSVPFHESPGSRVNSREEVCEEDILDINMVSQMTNSVPICSQSRPVRNAPLISPFNGSSPKDEEFGDSLDLVPQETHNSGVSHSSQLQSVRGNFLIPGAVLSRNPCNSGAEEECAEDNLEMSAQETPNSVLPIRCQGSTKELDACLQKDVNCVTMPSGGNDCIAAPLNIVANTADLSPGSGCNVRLSNFVDSNGKASSGFDEAEPTSVVNNDAESLKGIEDEDCPVFESILDLSKLLTRDRKYESDEDYYECVSKHLQYVTRKLVIQREEEEEPFGECLRIDSSKRWIAEELENNELDIDQITVKHCRTSWGPFDADAHSVIRSHNGENVLSYVCDHCFMEFNLDSLKAHLCSLFGRPINNEIKVAYARDNLL